MGSIVYNGCFGGFSVSRKALHRLRELGCGEALGETDFGETWPDTEQVNNSDFDAYCRNISRHDPLLVQVVRELGEEANGLCAELRIAELPDGTSYRIDEYDGNESVETKESYGWIEQT